MAKPGETPTTKPQGAQAMGQAPAPIQGAVQGGGAFRKPIQLEVTPANLERCRKDLHRKLARQVDVGHEGGDVGLISQLVNDIRALDLIEPTRVPPPAEQPRADPPDVAARKAAASDDAAMQQFNKAQAKKESIDAARSESTGE